MMPARFQRRIENTKILRKPGEALPKRDVAVHHAARLRRKLFMEYGYSFDTIRKLLFERASQRFIESS